MLNTILRNLISNAIKFTYSGGKISIDSVATDNFVKVSVADTGTGMTEDSMEKIFRIDTKYTTPGTNEEKGTGLGLILCKELVEKQGGEISVSSELDKGTIFTFTLPVPR
jgi:signal transduction histidine kinase